MKIGIDVGGTTTDGVLVDDNREVVASVKVSTTYPVEEGISKALDCLLEGATEVEELLIGTTHATNALLEASNLYRVGLIRIAGHNPTSLPATIGWPTALRDALFVGCETVSGGYECDGREISPLDEEEVKSAITTLIERGAESIAVVGTFSPLNETQEQQVAAWLPEELPVTLSSTLGGIGFLERENGALLNAALRRPLAEGFGSLARIAREKGITGKVALIQNNGSRLAVEEALDKPLLTISAGPTNSFVGAARLARLEDCLVVDIGGTSTDIGIVVAGQCRRSLDLSEIGGVALNFAMPDVISLPIGGGSTVSCGVVGPKSVGSRLKEESIAFAGETLTLSDIAMAAGTLLIEGGDRSRVPVTTCEAKQLLRGVMETIEQAVLRMAGRRWELPVLLVGGGAALFSEELLPARYRKLSLGGVANAYGAALGEISATIDRVVSLQERCVTLAGLREEAERLAEERGAVKPRIIQESVMPYHYLPDPVGRVTVTASG